MKIVKPSWVCSKEALFTCDVHPDGTKFATGGQGENTGNGKITIWLLAPVRSSKSEQATFKKHIATLEHHQGCVNCVRWSSSGKLASAGDDKVVMIWNAVSYEGSTSESYKCAHMLWGHQGDVLDIAWSCDDRYLASTSIDNTIIVWDCENFPEKVTTIKGHEGMVKGVVWDPIGRYLATQSTDKTLRVWRSADWKEETRVTEPFSKCGGTTTVLRLGWSPDGQYIVSSHAMNNEGPVAKIIEREQWKARMDFVGHRRAIESVRFNPRLFLYENRPVSCVALAGRDSSISVWLTSLKRPLFVLHDMFTSSVLDMSWTPDGYGLVICSLDGSLAFIELSSTELGRLVADEQQFKTSNVSQEKSTVIIEDPDLLDCDDSSQESQHQNGRFSTAEESDDTVMDTEDDVNNAPFEKLAARLERQDEESQLDDDDEPVQVSKKRRRSKPIGRIRKQKGTKRPNIDEARLSTAEESDDTEDDNVNTHNVNNLNTVNVNNAPFEKLEARLENNTCGFTQRQTVSDIKERQVETITKDGKRRIMPVALKEIPVIITQKQSEPKKRVVLTPVSNVAKSVPPCDSASTLNMLDIPVKLSKRKKLTPPVKVDTRRSDKGVQEKTFVTMAGTNIEIDNKIHVINFTRGNGITWSAALCGHVTTCCYDDNTLVIGCGDGSLHVLTGDGAHILPILNIGTPIVKSALSGVYVTVISDTPALYVWNIKTKKSILKDESLASFQNTITELRVSETGHVTIGLEASSSYCYDYNLSAWMLLTKDKLDDEWYKELASNTGAGPLASLHTMSRKVAPSSSHRDKTKLNTILLFEQQLLVSEALSSSDESRRWLSSLVRYLTLQGEDVRLRVLLQRIISGDEETVFGADRLEIAKDLLKIVATNVTFQRLYSDIKLQLEWLESRKGG